MELGEWGIKWEGREKLIGSKHSAQGRLPSKGVPRWLAHRRQTRHFFKGGWLIDRRLAGHHFPYFQPCPIPSLPFPSQGILFPLFCPVFAPVLFWPPFFPFHHFFAHLPSIHPIGHPIPGQTIPFYHFVHLPCPPPSIDPSFHPIPLLTDFDSRPPPKRPRRPLPFHPFSPHIIPWADYHRYTKGMGTDRPGPTVRERGEQRLC